MKRTKYEKKFFDIAENIQFQFDDEGKFSFAEYDRELYEIVNSLQSEIIENCTRLNLDERSIYLNRLRERLNIVGLPWYFVRDNPNQFLWNDKEGLTVNKEMPIDPDDMIEAGFIYHDDYENTYTISPEELQQYRKMLTKHKQLLLQVIIRVEKSLDIDTTETLPEPEVINSEQPLFVNNFDNIPPIEVYTHFKTGLVDKGYLTEEDLREYLKMAFELKTIPKSLFKLKNTPTKQKIYTVFYCYYKDIAGKIHNQQTRYVELLGNYFEGYKTETITTNWARDYTAKR